MTKPPIVSQQQLGDSVDEEPVEVEPAWELPWLPEAATEEPDPEEDPPEEEEPAALLLPDDESTDEDPAEEESSTDEELESPLLLESPQQHGMPAIAIRRKQNIVSSSLIRSALPAAPLVDLFTDSGLC
ncbi:MAG: hypothetical protein AAF394_01425 [Planctomycetota bacterium]